MFTPFQVGGVIFHDENYFKKINLKKNLVSQRHNLSGCNALLLIFCNVEFIGHGLYLNRRSLSTAPSFGMTVLVLLYAEQEFGFVCGFLMLNKSIWLQRNKPMIPHGNGCLYTSWRWLRVPVLFAAGS